VVWSLIAAAACSAPERLSEAGTLTAPEIRSRYEAVELGSARADVELTLGRPLSEWAQHTVPERPAWEAWYLPVPPLHPWDSPYAPGCIGVTYVDDRVIEKTLNPQVRAN
jgi:hypothetical protein